MATHVQIARIYDDPPDDGVRVLVDRIWPRGISKEKARLDDWCKAVAPSTDLRKWYAHDPERFAEFRRRYRRELGDAGHRAALDHLRDLGRGKTLILLTATREIDISAAAVLAEVLG